MEPNKKLHNFLVKCLSNTMDDDSIDPNKDFALLGIDSISVFDFTAQLKEVVPTVPLTIFLECQNLTELENYLIKNHHTELENNFKL